MDALDVNRCRVGWPLRSIFAEKDFSERANVLGAFSVITGGRTMQNLNLTANF